MSKIRSRNPDDYDLATYGGRLSFAIAYSGLQIQQVARALGVTASAVTQQCSSTRTEGGPRHRSTLARILRVPVEWLAFGRGPGPEGLGTQYDGPNEHDCALDKESEHATFPTVARANPDDFKLETFGGRLSYAIARAGRTVAEVAAAMEISRSAVYQLCSSASSDGGGRQPQRLAALLDVPVQWLTYRLGPEPASDFHEQDKRPVQNALPPQLVLPAKGLTFLQLAVLEKLHAAMKVGRMDDKACLDLLTQLDK